MVNEEKQETTMTLTEFTNEIQRINNIGIQLTAEHRRVFGNHAVKSKARNSKNNYHAPATQAECGICMKIIQAHDDMMKLQADQIGLTGIPLDALFSAIKITKSTITMMQNEGLIKKVDS